MSKLISDSLDSYLTSLCLDPLATLQDKALDFSHPSAAISCGPVVGNFLQMLVSIQRPMHILELGTMLGYSALCMALAMPRGARLVSIEKYTENWERACKNCAKAGFSESELLVLNMSALEFLQTEEFSKESWDLVFLDADKGGYEKYYTILLERMKSGSIIVADNVLFRAQVHANNPGKIAQAMNKFNQRIFNDSRVQFSILPVRDGLQIIRKK